MKNNDLSAIVKVTTKCNLACTYCYEDKKFIDMEESVLKSVIQKISSFNKVGSKNNFIWHGGEPLARGIDFFENAIKLQSDMGKKYEFDNKLQTNAILINDDWVKFFIDNKFKVGVSIDGNKKSHDSSRVYLSGDGSFDDVFNGIEKLKSKNLLEGAICVVNKNNIDCLVADYNFFNKMGVNIKYLPILKIGEGEKNYEDLRISSNEYGLKMKELFNHWWKEKSSIVIDPFDPMIENLLTGLPLGCNYKVNCYDNFISIDPTGEVYPCGRFSNFKDFYMGNINERSIEELMSSDPKKYLKERDVTGCKPCKYYENCNSDCPLTSYIENKNINDKSNSCDSNKILFSHIEKILLNK